MALCTRVASLTRGVFVSCNKIKTAISGFRCEVAGNCTLQGYYAPSSGNSLQTLWDNLLVPSSGFKNSKKKKLIL